MPSRVASIIAQNVTALIEGPENDLTRVDIASRARIGRRSLGKIEAATVNPQVDTLESLAKILRVEPWQLLAPDLGANIAAAQSSRFDEVSSSAKKLIDTIVALDHSERAPAEFYAHLAKSIESLAGAGAARSVPSVEARIVPTVEPARPTAEFEALMEWTADKNLQPADIQKLMQIAGQLARREHGRRTRAA